VSNEWFKNRPKHWVNPNRKLTPWRKIMASIGLIIVSLALGTQYGAVAGWLMFGIGLIIFAIIDKLMPPEN
jgi:4-hydroxybenzoate polyprenyltransferase